VEIGEIQEIGERVVETPQIAPKEAPAPVREPEKVPVKEPA
jgi:hypothetical protein